MFPCSLLKMLAHAGMMAHAGVSEAPKAPGEISLGVWEIVGSFGIYLL